MRTARSNPKRRGVTLIELLVVISILLLLVAAAVPMMRPAMEGRRIREAARAINVYLSTARFEAMRTRRPVGVMIERLDGQPQCSMVINQAEVPPTYAGDTIDAKVRVQTVDRTTGEVRIFVQRDVFSDGLVRRLDRIQFNNQGPWYWITGGPDSSPPGDPNYYYYDFGSETDNDGDLFIDTGYLTATLTLGTTQGGTPPWPDSPPAAPTSKEASAPVTFQIQRMPVKSTAKPLQLPSGVVVDLDASGGDQVPFWPITWHTNPPPLQDFNGICIMFSPAGAVDRFFTYSGFWRPIPPVGPPVGFEVETRIYFGTDPVFLLVGRRERVSSQPLPATPTRDEMPNWMDMGNLWVTLNPQTGLVSVAENAPVNAAEDPVADPGCDPNGVVGNAPDFSWSDASTWDAAIRQTRRYARQAQSMGGR